jgi:hypothetical protein
VKGAILAGGGSFGSFFAGGFASTLAALVSDGKLLSPRSNWVPLLALAMAGKPLGATVAGFGMAFGIGTERTGSRASCPSIPRFEAMVDIFGFAKCRSLSWT